MNRTNPITNQLVFANLLKFACLLTLIVTGASEACARMFDPELGRWTRRDPLGYVDGMSLYEWARSSPLVTLDSSGLYTLQECYDAISHCRTSDPGTRSIIKQIIDNDCQVPSLVCKECDHGDPGEYDCKWNAIEICPNNIDFYPGFCEAVRHELIHSLDACLGLYCNFEWRVGIFAANQNRCYKKACTELRACALSGECCSGGTRRQVGETYEDCIRQCARASIPWRCWFNYRSWWGPAWEDCLLPEVGVCNRPRTKPIGPPNSSLGDLNVPSCPPCSQTPCTPGCPCCA